MYKFLGKPGEDFQIWKIRTEAALAAKEALEMVTTNVVGAATQQSPLSADDQKLVDQARAVLIQGLGDKPLRMCMAYAENPFIMWKKLQERYSVTNVVTKVQLQTHLSQLSYNGQVMSDYIDTFEEVFNRLAGMDSAVNEDMQVAMLLASFGDKARSPYGHVISSMQTVDVNLTWEIVTSRLLQ